MARKTVKRWFWVWDFDKEEAWLNEMAGQGWVLDGVRFCTYDFKSCEPGEYAVRLEMLENGVDTEESKEYIEFVEDTGAEYVGNEAKWVYFRKKAAEGGFELFSDIDSRIGHLKRVISLVVFFGALNLFLGINALRYSLLGVINLFLAAVLAYAVHRLQMKVKRLEGERRLHE